jgi:peptidoglycan/xylan/chitin deacetylase (PgdA/CDA1 family)
MALHMGARLGHGLVLVYHRVLADADCEAGSVVPSVYVSCLRQHVDLLSAVGDVVPLDTLLEPSGDRRRPRFAITFDDDYVEHLTHVRAVLSESGVPATFFLSGRVLQGLGAYWWEQLEWLIADRGVRRTARTLGLPPGTPRQLAAACETDVDAQRRLAVEAPADTGARLDGVAIQTLAGTPGVTIGFHTVRHELLTRLDDAALRTALTEGRADLEALVGRRLAMFAYPHGKAGRRVAAAVRAAGYRAAWTGAPAPIRQRDDRFLLGRWECGPLDAESLVASVAVRLHRSAAASA